MTTAQILEKISYHTDFTFDEILEVEISDEDKEMEQLMASCDRDDDMCHDEFLINYWDL